MKRDPVLESLFDKTEESLQDDGFTAGVVERIMERRRHIIAGRLIILGLLISLEVVLESPVQRSLGIVSEALVSPLLTLNGEWLAFILAPVNSVAGLLGTVLLGLYYLYRHITH